jgi:hypothetical protein
MASPLDRPVGLSNVLDRMLQVAKQQFENLAIEIAATGFFNGGEFVSNPPLRLQ